MPVQPHDTPWQVLACNVHAYQRQEHLYVNTIKSGSAPDPSGLPLTAPQPHTSALTACSNPPCSLQILRHVGASLHRASPLCSPL